MKTTIYYFTADETFNSKNDGPISSRENGPETMNGTENVFDNLNHQSTSEGIDGNETLTQDESDSLRNGNRNHFSDELGGTIPGQENYQANNLHRCDLDGSETGKMNYYQGDSVEDEIQGSGLGSMQSLTDNFKQEKQPDKDKKVKKMKKSKSFVNQFRRCLPIGQH